MAYPLAADVVGTGPRLALVHGFTQTRRAWGRFGELLARHFELVLVDAPGHGDSSGVEADLPTSAAMVGETAGRAAYLGYSMGGRVALRLAVDRPDLVERLVLIGTSPGLLDEEERRARAISDDRLARHLEEVGLDVFLDEWLARPLFATLSKDAAQLEPRKTNTVSGLASSLRRAGTGHQEPLWDRLGSLTMPVLLITGADDTRFTATARRMADAIGPHASTRTIAGAGHAVHLEHPDETAGAVLEWMGAS